MKYTFAIDETGRFTFNHKQKSFVCGVLIKANEYTLKQKYKEVFQQLFSARTEPDTTEKLIGNEQLHYTKLSFDQKNICKTNLLPFPDKIFVSTGMPLLFANNQNYWQIAVTAVIAELFKNHNFEKGDQIDILIDFRKDIVWGTLEGTSPEFLQYHQILGEQFEKVIQPFQNALDLKINIKFVSDTKSFFVNLADIVCGLVRDDENIPTVKCPCEKVFSQANPHQIYKNNPLAALNIIFQELLNGAYNNVPLIKPILEANRSNEEPYNQIWDGLYSFLKYQINHRYSEGNFHELIGIKDLFLFEFERHYTKISNGKQLEFITLFVEYASHNGEIKHPFEQKFVLKIMEEDRSESRLLRKWEKWISYQLRSTQISFNTYDFDTAENNLKELWAKQDNIIKPIPFENKKDEHTVAIMGTLAQSYAYKGKLKEAIEYFELSLEYAVKTSSQTYFYLFSCYFSLKDIENASVYFEKLAGCTAQKYVNKKSKDVWDLLAYAKLRALVLHLLNKTELPQVLPQENSNTAYPYPLVLKWLAIALLIEDKEQNKAQISKYLSEAIDSLSDETNGFTIKTLALPLIQIYALVDNTNPFHSQYNKLVAELIKDNVHFKDFVEKSVVLNNIKNDSDYWQRANTLPFIYS